MKPYFENKITNNQISFCLTDKANIDEREIHSVYFEYFNIYTVVRCMRTASEIMYKSGFISRAFLTMVSMSIMLPEILDADIMLSRQVSFATRSLRYKERLCILLRKSGNFFK